MLRAHCEFCDGIVNPEKAKDIERTIQDAGLSINNNRHYCCIECLVNELQTCWKERTE